MYFISSNFIKEIPVEKKDIVIKRLQKFRNELLRTRGVLSEVSNSFWIRKLQSTDIFKFRINNGDRILFKFIQTMPGQEYIAFLHYCTHDQQVYKGKRTKVPKIHVADFVIDQSPDDNDIESKFEKEFLNQHANCFNSTGQAVLENYSLIYAQEGMEDIFIKENSNDFLYYLKNNQATCLKVDNKPVILSGCPGSGKTLLAIHKLLACAQAGLKGGYFTHSRLLKHNTQAIYEKYASLDDGSICFYTTEEYLKETAGQNCEIVNEERFAYWYDKNKLSLKLKAEARDIWSELRGILRGFMGYDWARLSENSDAVLISQEEYQRLPDDYSCLKKTDREQIYRIAQKYTDWLKKDSLEDYNSLAWRILKNSKRGISTAQFDFIIIDEVQDFSEVEIASLLTLGKSGCHCILAGDIRQCITPNYFDFKRIRNLFYEQKLDYSEVYLNQSFRNSTPIMKLMNRVTELRNAFIKPLPKPFQNCDTSDIHGAEPVVIFSDNVEARKLLEYVGARADSAIIVPNEGIKSELKSFDEWGRVFTISEIKGLQYENVICYKFSSTRDKRWNAIFERQAKGTVSFHYDFNLLYTAFSRARSKLFIYEDQSAANSALVEKLLPCLASFSRQVQPAPNSKKSDWFEEAKRLELSGNYTQAKKIYEKLHAKDGINRCSTEQEKNKAIFDNVFNKLFSSADKMKTILRIEDVIPLNAATVAFILSSLLDKYNVELTSNVELNFRTRDDGFIITKRILNERVGFIDELSIMIEELLQKPEILPTQVTIEMELANNGQPTYIYDDNGDPYYTLKIIIQRNKRGDIKNIQTLNIGNVQSKVCQEMLDLLHEKPKQPELIDQVVASLGSRNVQFKMIEYKEKRQKALGLLSVDKNEEASSILKDVILLQNELLEYKEVDDVIKKPLRLLLGESYSNLGLCHLRLDELTQAEENFKLALSYEPENLNAMINLGLVYEKQGQFSNSVDCYSKILTIWPDNVKAYYYRALLYFAQENYVEAKTDFLAIIKYDSQHGLAYGFLSILAAKENLHDEALKYARLAHEFSKEELQTGKLLFNALVGLGVTDEAKELAKDLFGKYKEDTEVKAMYKYCEQIKPSSSDNCFTVLFAKLVQDENAMEVEYYIKQQLSIKKQRAYSQMEYCASLIRNVVYYIEVEKRGLETLSVLIGNKAIYPQVLTEKFIENEQFVRQAIHKWDANGIKERKSKSIAELEYEYAYHFICYTLLMYPSMRLIENNTDDIKELYNFKNEEILYSYKQALSLRHKKIMNSLSFSKKL